MAIGDKVRRAEQAQAAREADDQEDPLSEGAETPDAAPISAVRVVAPPAPAPTAASTDLQALIAGLAAAIQQGTAGAIEQTKPKRHSRDDAEFENRSAYNPAGELHRPRPGLTVPTFYGVLADHEGDPPIPLYEIESAQTTYDEQILLNQLVAGRGDLELNDGSQRPYEVYVPVDRVSKQPLKCVIGLPKEVFEKGMRNQLPGLQRLAQDLVGQQTSA